MKPPLMLQGVQKVPRVRALRLFGKDDRAAHIQEAFTDGSIHTLIAFAADHYQGMAFLPLQQLVYVFLTTLMNVHRHRTFHRAPFAEYACSLRMEIPSSMYLVGEPRPYADKRIGAIREKVRLPTYSVGGIEEIDELTTLFLRDICNAAGVDPSNEFMASVNENEVLDILESQSSFSTARPF